MEEAHQRQELAMVDLVRRGQTLELDRQRRILARTVHGIGWRLSFCLLAFGNPGAYTVAAAVVVAGGFVLSNEQ